MAELFINEIFKSIQGEGFHAGSPCFFVRTQGCRVGCFFCDEKKTWKHQASSSMTIEQIVNKLEELDPKLKRVTISGGEPTEQDLSELIAALKEKNYFISIETAGCGAYSSVLYDDDKQRAKLWITLSPKEIYGSGLNIEVNPNLWRFCSELKFVIAKPEAEKELLENIIPKLEQAENKCPIYLVPDWFNFEPNRDLAIRLCQDQPERLKLGLQSHKYLQIA